MLENIETCYLCSALPATLDHFVLEQGLGVYRYLAPFLNINGRYAQSSYHADSRLAMPSVPLLLMKTSASLQ
jgi:hypothetical protein